MTRCPSSIKTIAKNPTPYHIAEFKSALRRGIRRGEQNPGIMCWMFFGSHAAAFIPTKWAYELMKSDEFKDLLGIAEGSEAEGSEAEGSEAECTYGNPFRISDMEVMEVFTSKKINSTKKRKRQFSDFMDEMDELSQ